ncbi:ABC-type nitrate/sulfonate/bicarbonate transport system, substrate-binding protein [Kushneria avicenniae]|uniref:ABC-type nitrate/sulfonate/bicarbonate transport system, substrate-binding protein n=1 Tax=Kushneria avicenniae TaxID=402385 RepID=A0A1I1N506_9GAMM|nr:ABC transporter substrate-binding protein [Kushneria avicenniae]SFC88860.1 ABC-type nitrate/sulfonate/bicarbonate transport system, substrate-binding protein [Kushneria avicenniae]
MKKHVLLLSALLLSGQALMIGQAQASQQSADAPEPVTIRYLSSRGQISLPELADAKGWLKPEGVALESEGFSQGGPESLFAMASGSIDIAGAATSATINAIANGADIVSVMASSGVNEAVNSRFYVLDDSPIREPKDLIGKTIAVNTLGAHLDYVVREYLRQNHIPRNAVRLVAVPGPQLEQTLRSGQIDVAAVGAWQTVFAGQLEHGGGVRSLFDDHQLLGDITLSPYSMTRDFIEAHPDAVQALVTQSGRAADWARENPQEARELIGRLLAERNENPQLAHYWAGYGVRDHAELNDHDVQYWLDVLEREGSLNAGQLTIGDIATNAYNKDAGNRLAQRGGQ